MEVAYLWATLDMISIGLTKGRASTYHITLQICVLLMIIYG